MIKLTVGEQKPQEVNQFPRLMCHKLKENFVILFTSPSAGVVVAEGMDRTLGEHRTDWIEDNFEDFNGEVKLQNV